MDVVYLKGKKAILVIVAIVFFLQTGCTPNSMNELEKKFVKYDVYFNQAIEICNRYPEFKEVRMENSLIEIIVNMGISDDPSYLRVGILHIGKYHLGDGELVEFDSNRVELFVSEIEPIFKKLDIMAILSYSDDRIEIISHSGIRGAYGWIYMRDGVVLPSS